MNVDLQEHYPWTRRWSLRDDPDGDLTASQRHVLRVYSQNEPASPKKRLRDFHAKPCLVLMGPAGAGKSEAAKQLQTTLEAEGASVFLFDLGSYGVNGELRDDIKDDLRGRREDDLQETVFILDGLDECPAQAPLEAACRTLQRLYREKAAYVRLRVVCRAAYWAARSDLEGALEEVWDEVAVADIEPLGREDVEIALRAEGLNAEDFWRDVGRASTQALTRQPLTLRLLLEEYLKGNESLPSTRTALYMSACLRLAGEHHPRRRKEAHLSNDQRLEVLRPLAAVMILGQRPALWVGDPLLRPAQDLMLDGMLGQGVQLPGSRALRREDLLEAKDTGFLKGTQSSETIPERLTWVERTFAEFLAAQFLKTHELTLGQLLDLLAAPNDPARRIAPPMHEVASWLAAWRSDLFDHMLETDPVVLLTGDAPSFSDKERLALARRLLGAYDLGRLVALNHVLGPGCRQLAAPGLDELLASYIEGEEHQERAREVAVMLASWNGRTSLLPDLIKLATDRKAPASLRAEAANAVGQVGGETALGHIAPLLDLSDDEDPTRVIRGAVLGATYPSFLSFADVAPHLDAFQRGSMDARYELFVERDLVPGLTPSELPDAFEWLARQEAGQQGSSRSEPDGSLSNLEHALCLRAADLLVRQEEIDNQGAEVIANALAGRLAVLSGRDEDLPSNVPWYLDRNAKSSFDTLWAKHPRLRRRIVRLLLAREEQLSEQLALWLAGFRGALRPAEDLNWILQEARSEAAGDMKRRWIELARHLFIAQDADILRPYFDDGMIRAAFAAHIGLPKDTEASDVLAALEQQHRENVARQKRWKREREEREAKRKVKRPTADDLDQALEHLTSGDNPPSPGIPWQVVLRELTGRKQARRDITYVRQSPAWQEASTTLQRRILDAARDFLRAVQFDPAEWTRAPNVWGDFPIKAVAALRLLQAERMDAFDDWDEAEQERWAALVAAYEPVTDEDTDALGRLLEQLYRCAPEAVTSAARARVDAANRSEQRRSYLPALRKFGRVWDERLANALSEELGDLALNPYTYSTVLDHLLPTGYSAPWERAAEHLEEARFEEGARKPDTARTDNGTEEDDEEEHLRRRALEAAVNMLKCDPDRAWPLLWPIFEASDAFADRLVRRASRMLWGRDTTVLTPLCADQLETLYRQLSRLYPHEEDPERLPGRAYSPTSRDDAGRFRGSVLQKLQRDGQSIHVQRIRAAFPQLEWLAETQRRTDEIAMEAAWRPHAPEEVLRLARDRSAHLARSGTELLEAVVEALHRLERELRGHPPAAYDLWNTLPRNRLFKVAAAALQKATGNEYDEAIEVIQDLAGERKGNRPRYVPKEETDISDYVARYLERELGHIVIGREVEVRPGDKPDLRVSTFVPGASPSDERAAHVAIEVKGSWNGKLFKAIQAQLSDRYLASPDCRHGVYLVAWPYCEGWHNSDWRKGKARRGGIEKLKRKLSERAEALSRKRRVVRAVVIDTSLPDSRANRVARSGS